jgi:hypothetical protein
VNGLGKEAPRKYSRATIKFSTLFPAYGPSQPKGTKMLRMHSLYNSNQTRKQAMPNVIETVITTKRLTEGCERTVQSL